MNTHNITLAFHIVNENNQIVPLELTEDQQLLTSAQKASWQLWRPIVSRIRDTCQKKDIIISNRYEMNSSKCWIHILLLTEKNLSASTFFNQISNSDLRPVIDIHQRNNPKLNIGLNSVYAPIISISNEDIINTNTYDWGKETSEKVKTSFESQFFDNRFKFLDSSIWHRYVPINPVDSKIGFDEYLEEVLNEVIENWNLGLYYTNSAVTSLEFQLRMLRYSYIGQFGDRGHAEAVTPFKFHSEGQLKKQTETLIDEFFLKNYNGKTLLESIQYRVLLADDFAIKPLATIEKNNICYVTQGQLVRYSIDKIYKSKGLNSTYLFELIVPDNNTSIIKFCKHELAQNVIDIVFLGYILETTLGDNKNVKTHEYGYTLVLELIQDKNSSQNLYTGDFWGRHWIFPVYTIPYAFNDKLRNLGLSDFDSVLRISGGGDPVTTPHQYTLSFFRLLQAKIIEYCLLPDRLKNLFARFIDINTKGNKIDSAKIIETQLKNYLSLLDFLNQQDKHVPKSLLLSSIYKFLIYNIDIETLILAMVKTTIKNTDPNASKESVQNGITMLIIMVSTRFKDYIESLNMFLRIIYIPQEVAPPEVIEQGSDAILRYIEEKERSGLIKVREAKLLIVGQGGAGKTTLRDKFLDPNSKLPPPDDSTRGIEIRQIIEKIPNSAEIFKLNIWDFGGQNIQHFAHQFFLSGSSLYVLVSNEREQNTNFQYWLNIIEMLGGASPVIIVQNKIAGHFEEIRNPAAIRERYGNVFNRFFTLDLKDAATDQEFKDLRNEIVFRASQLPHVEREYPISFNLVREKLETIAATGKYFLNWEEFVAIGVEFGIENNDNLVKDYANAFTLLGVCQYFPDDLQLHNFIFLNPKWIIDALFQLLYHPIIEQQNGVFHEKDSLEIWKNVEYRGMEGRLIRMMENFEFCYRIMTDSYIYIVPQRLPAEKHSYNWNESNTTLLLYEYKFIPKGIVTRLICRLHIRIEENHVWNDAVIFTQPDGKARVFVREVYGENRIEIQATGEKKEGLLNEVIRHIDDLHNTSKFANLQVDKKVPCPCPECIANPFSRHFYKYDFLEKTIDKGKTKVQCVNTTDYVLIEKIFAISGLRNPRLNSSFNWSENDFKEFLKNLIILGDMDKAQQLMQDHFPSQSEVILQLSRLNSLEKEERIGKLTLEEYLRMKNQIVDGILRTLDRL